MAKSNPTANVVSVLASLGGLGLGLYAGINLLFPGLISALAFFSFRRLFPANKQVLVPSISWQLGQLGWMVIGMALAPNGLKMIGLDVGLMAAGLLWLYLSAGRAAAITLIVYQVLSLAVNALAFSAGAIDSPTDKALAVHMVWRVVAVGLLVIFLMAPRAKNIEGVAASFD